jgi:hypothetical protein
VAALHYFKPMPPDPLVIAIAKDSVIHAKLMTGGLLKYAGCLVTHLSDSVSVFWRLQMVAIRMACAPSQCKWIEDAPWIQ